MVGLPDLVKTVRQSVPQRSGPGPAGPAKSGAVVYPGLDPSAVAAARAAGFPGDQLAKLAAAAGKQPALKEAPKRAQRPRNVLSESEEEEDATALGIGGDGEQLGSQPAVERAVVQLAKIVAIMQKEKSSKSGLEGILEKAEGGGSADSSGAQSGGSRGKAAAFKKLKAALQENPEWLYSNVEALMDEDFNLVRAAPGVSHQPTTTRAWLGASEQAASLSEFSASSLADRRDSRCLERGASSRSSGKVSSGHFGLRSGRLGQRELAAGPRALPRVSTALQLFSGQKAPRGGRTSLVAPCRRALPSNWPCGG